jgi:hypothetical protein
MSNLIVTDLRQFLNNFSLRSLLNLRYNSHRLLRGAYHEGTRGCFVYLLTEPWSHPIESKEALIDHFGPKDAEGYVAPRDLVRAWDGLLVPRYGDVVFTSELLMAVVDQEIRRRISQTQVGMSVGPAEEHVPV